MKNITYAICIDNKDSMNNSIALTLEKEYEVIKIKDGLITIINDKGKSNRYSMARFVLVEKSIPLPPKMQGLEVMCINNKNHEEQLTIGKKYYVMKDGALGDSVYIETDDGRIFEMRRDRFVYVDHENNVILR